MIHVRPRYEACELVACRGVGHVFRVVATAWTAPGARRRAHRQVAGPVAIFDTLSRIWLADDAEPAGRPSEKREAKR